jgi:hypothetical protein
MQTPAQEFRSFNELMAKLGYFLYRWSTLALQLNDGIIAARERLHQSATKIKGTFAERGLSTNGVQKS